MAVSLLSGFPVSASKALSSALTLATASHSASGACKIFVCLAAEGQAAITNTAITDNTGGTIGTWTRHVSKVWTGGAKNSFSWTEIWVADCSAAYTSKVITLTVTGGGAQIIAGMSVYAVTGFNSGTPIGAEDNNAATNGSATHLIAGAVTSTATGSLVIGVGGDGDAFLTFAAQTGTTLDKQLADGTINSSYSTFHKTATTTSGTGYTVGTTKSDDMFVYAVLEIAASSSTVTGTGAATLAAMTGSAAGSSVTGTGAATLAAMTGSATGAHGVAGTAAANLAAMTGAAAGSSVTGAAAATLAAMTGSASGAHGVAGTASATLAAMTGAAAGSSVTGAGAATFDTMVGAGTGTQSISGVGAATFDGMTGAASGSSVIGTASATFADTVGEASGTHGVGGDGAAQFDAMTGTGTGTAGNLVTGTGSATFDAMTGTAFGTVGTFVAALLDGLKVRPLGETFAQFADRELELEPKGEATRVVVLDQRG